MIRFHRVGTVGLTEYMTFMISRETENVSSIDDVVLAFKSLTENSERPYITRDELYAVSFPFWPIIIKIDLLYRIYRLNKPISVAVRWNHIKIEMAVKSTMHMIMMILLDGYLINNHIQVTVIIHQRYHRLHHHGFKHRLISHESKRELHLISVYI